jgi:hypothetical protein
LGGVLLVGFQFQFFFEIDDFQARAHPAATPQGGEGVHPAKFFNFFVKLTIFLARAGTPLPPWARARARVKMSI